MADRPIQQGLASTTLRQALTEFGEFHQVRGPPGHPGFVRTGRCLGSSWYEALRVELTSNFEHGPALPHDARCLVGLPLEERRFPNARSSLRSPRLTNLGWPKTLGGLECACQAEQPFEFQIDIDLVRFDPGWHDFLLLPTRGMLRYQGSYNPTVIASIQGTT